MGSPRREHFVLYRVPITFMAETVFPEQTFRMDFFCKTTEGACRQLGISNAQAARLCESHERRYFNYAHSQQERGRVKICRELIEAMPAVSSSQPCPGTAPLLRPDAR